MNDANQVKLYSLAWFIWYFAALLFFAVITAIEYLLFQWICRHWKLRITVETAFSYAMALGLCLIILGQSLSMPLVGAVGGVLAAPVALGAGLLPILPLYLCCSFLSSHLTRWQRRWRRK